MEQDSVRSEHVGLCLFLIESGENHGDIQMGLIKGCYVTICTVSATKSMLLSIGLRVFRDCIDPLVKALRIHDKMEYPSIFI